jgi:hypothetical protein
MINKPGYYSSTVEDVILAESKSNGTPSLKFKLFVAEVNDHAYFDAWLTDRALENTVNNLNEVFSFNGDFLDLNQFKGKDCQIKIVTEEYEGKAVAKVAYLNPVGGRKPAAMDEDKAKSLAERLNRRAAELARKNEKANLPF